MQDTAETGCTGDGALPAFVDPRLAQARSHDPGHWLIESRFSNGLPHWSCSRAAAMAAARSVGLAVAQAVVSPDRMGLLMQKDTVDRATKTPLEAPGARACFEEEGGPGLRACFDFVDANSSFPIVDVHALLRWSLVSYVLGHTEQNAGHVVLRRDADDPNWRLAPFPWMTAFATLACDGPYPQPLGMRIGGAWADDHVMVHQLVALAQWARVKPKIVFTMAEEIAATMPQALGMALLDQYKAPHNSTARRILLAARIRAQRITEICLAAPRQGVPGLKRKPVIYPETGEAPEESEASEQPDNEDLRRINRMAAFGPHED